MITNENDKDNPQDYEQVGGLGWKTFLFPLKKQK